MITIKQIFDWVKTRLKKKEAIDPTLCPTCFRVLPIPDWHMPGERRLLNPEWIAWYRRVHRASEEEAWQQGAANVLVSEFPMKTRHHASTYKIIGHPLRVGVKYNDL